MILKVFLSKLLWFYIASALYSLDNLNVQMSMKIKQEPLYLLQFCKYRFLKKLQFFYEFRIKLLHFASWKFCTPDFARNSHIARLAKISQFEVTRNSPLFSIYGAKNVGTRSWKKAYSIQPKSWRRIFKYFTCIVYSANFISDTYVNSKGWLKIQSDFPSEG